jgi:hypothetical protein
MSNIWCNEKGLAFPLSLAFIAILSILGTMAVVMTTTDLKIGGRHRTALQAFYAADAGTEEARERIRGGSASNIPDPDQTEDDWRAYIGSATDAAAIGYNNGDSNHYLYSCLETDTNYDYLVEIKHLDDGAGNVMRWGDDDGDSVPEPNINTGENIYVVTSYGTVNGLEKTVRTEIVRNPPVWAPAALYVEAPTTLQGTSTFVIGVNQTGCGADPDVAGVSITLGAGSITENGLPNIDGNPPKQYDAPNLDVQSMIDSMTNYADFAYNVTSHTFSGTDVPGPGDGWGTPVMGATLQDASSCGTADIVHIDTGGTYVRLQGGTQGCGVLLVEGNLDIHGNFFWYGLIIVSGHVTFTGGGNKNVTGAVLSGGSALADVVGGNANIIYCGNAVQAVQQNRTFRRISWMEVTE